MTKTYKLKPPKCPQCGKRLRLVMVAKPQRYAYWCEKCRKDIVDLKRKEQDA